MHGEEAVVSVAADQVARGREQLQADRVAATPPMEKKR